MRNSFGTVLSRLQLLAMASWEVAKARSDGRKLRAKERQRLTDEVRAAIFDDVNAARADAGLGPSTPLTRGRRSRASRQHFQQRAKYENAPGRNRAATFVVFAGAVAAVLTSGRGYDEATMPLPDVAPRPPGISAPDWRDVETERFIVDTSRSTAGKKSYVSRWEGNILPEERRSITVVDRGGTVEVSGDGSGNAQVDRAWVVSQGPRNFKVSAGRADADGNPEASVEVARSAVDRRNAYAVVEFTDGSKGMVGLS